MVDDISYDNPHRKKGDPFEQPAADEPANEPWVDPNHITQEGEVDGV